MNNLKGVVDSEFERFIIDLKAKVISDDTSKIVVFQNLDEFKDVFESELRKKVLTEINRWIGKRSIFNFKLPTKLKVKNVLKPKQPKQK